jgi:hypothetical protein
MQLRNCLSNIDLIDCIARERTRTTHLCHPFRFYSGRSHHNTLLQNRLHAQPATSQKPGGAIIVSVQIAVQMCQPPLAGQNTSTEAS